MLDGGPVWNARSILYGTVGISFVFLVALSSTVQSLGTVALLSLGPLLVLGTFAGHLAGAGTITGWRRFLFGVGAAAVTVLLAMLALLSGTHAVALPGFASSLFAAVAAALS